METRPRWPGVCGAFGVAVGESTGLNWFGEVNNYRRRDFWVVSRVVGAQLEIIRNGPEQSSEKSPTKRSGTCSTAVALETRSARSYAITLHLHVPMSGRNVPHSMHPDGDDELEQIKYVHVSARSSIAHTVCIDVTRTSLQ